MVTDAALVDLVDEVGEEVMRGAVVRLRATLEDGAPFDTGLLTSSIESAATKRSAKAFNAEIRQRDDIAPHGKMLDAGTGIFGPTRQPIRPKRAKALRFEVGGRTIFATSVKGSGKHKGWWSKFDWDRQYGEALRDAGRAINGSTF